VLDRLQLISAAIPLLLSCQSTPTRSADSPRSAMPTPTRAAAPSRSTVTPPPAPTSIDRPTSPAYDGDLSIFEHPERDQRLQVDRMMDLLGITTGASVADVGAGGGWFTVRAARRVGPTGEVYAVEINPTYVKHIAARATRERLENVHAIEGAESDPRLPQNTIDVVLLLKTYHELSEPLALLKQLRRAMRPNARLGVADRNGAGDDHGLDEAVVRKEITSTGFTFRERHDWPSAEERVDYFLIFVR
jgi:SAM-dependent methyltransferase